MTIENDQTRTVHLGIADHLGWAVAVTATDNHHVVDRRRLEMVDPELSAAPIHYDRGRLDDAATAELVDRVRRSAFRVTASGLDEIEHDLAEPISSISLRSWPDDFPSDIGTLRRAPYDARADAVMYRRVLEEIARSRGWAVHFYDAKGIEVRAAAILGEAAEGVLQGPRTRLGPPWAKDHRVALAATIVAG